MEDEDWTITVTSTVASNPIMSPTKGLFSIVESSKKAKNERHNNGIGVFIDKIEMKYIFAGFLLILHLSSSMIVRSLKHIEFQLHTKRSVIGGCG